MWGWRSSGTRVWVGVDGRAWSSRAVLFRALSRVAVDLGAVRASGLCAPLAASPARLWLHP